MEKFQITVSLYKKITVKEKRPFYIEITKNCFGFNLFVITSSIIVITAVIGLIYNPVKTLQ